MPKGQKRRCYCDADVFLAYINGEIGRLEVVEEHLRQSKAGKIVIMTSMLSLSEVAFSAMEKGEAAVDADTERAIDELWNDRQAIRLIEVTRAVNIAARGLIRDGIRQRWTFKPSDAIHLAAAQLYNADVLYTYNLRDFKRWESVLGIPIKEPTLTEGLPLLEGHEG